MATSDGPLMATSDGQVAASDQYRVVLSDINVDSDGEYTCEVVGEAPRFESSRATASMRVFGEVVRRGIVSVSVVPVAPFPNCSFNSYL